MTAVNLLILLGVLFGSSLGCMALESAQAIHPTVRKVFQAMLCVAAGIYVGRLFGLLPV